MWGIFLAPLTDTQSDAFVTGPAHSTEGWGACERSDNLPLRPTLISQASPFRGGMHGFSLRQHGLASTRRYLLRPR
jgi:hypothetical protein